MTFTHPGGGAAQPSDLPVLPRRWGWHGQTHQLCVVMPVVDYTQANCTGREDLYLAESVTREQVSEAEGLCNACPIKKQCHAWALAHEQYGYRAGTTPAQRAEQRKVIGLRVIEPATAHVFGLNDDPMDAFPEQCDKGHHLKAQYDAVVSKSQVNTRYRTDYEVSCTQCYWERTESPEARERQTIKARAGAAALKKKGTRNTPRKNKWGG